MISKTINSTCFDYETGMMLLGTTRLF